MSQLQIDPCGCAPAYWFVSLLQTQEVSPSPRSSGQHPWAAQATLFRLDSSHLQVSPPVSATRPWPHMHSNTAHPPPEKWPQNAPLCRSAPVSSSGFAEGIQFPRARMLQPHWCLTQGAGMTQRWQEATASVTLLPTALWHGQQPRRDRGVQDRKSVV